MELLWCGDISQNSITVHTLKRRGVRLYCGKIHRAVPEFKPQWNAREGVQQLYDAYRAVNLTPQRLSKHPLLAD